MNKRYPYVHIFNFDELSFSGILIQTFKGYCEEKNLPPMHYITVKKNVYEAFKDEADIEYFDSDNQRTAAVFNYAGSIADWVFSHGICDPLEFLKIKKSYLKKIVWRSWGGNALKPFAKGTNPLKNLAFSIINKAVYRRVKCLKAIGIANLVDQLELSKAFGELTYFRIPYGRMRYREMVDLREHLPPPDDIFRIMIGHSAYPDDKHIELADALLRFKNEKIQLYFPLSYGDESYRDRVKAHLEQTWGEQAVVITERLPFEEYVALLATMNVAVLPAPFSYALGNVCILLFFQKKLFLNAQSVIAEAFERLHIPYCDVQALQQMSFEQLITPLDYSEAECEEMTFSKNRTFEKCWDDIFSYLNRA